jgi:proteasome lid subunit RPN8/RPN11
LSYDLKSDDFFFGLFKQGTAQMPQRRILNAANIAQLARLRHDHAPVEIAGRLDFNTTGSLKHVSLNRGNDNASNPGHCAVCYHSHPDHPLPSPPSATDLMSAYITPARLHVLLSREGMYIFHRIHSTPLGKTLAKHHSLSYTRKHWISEHVRQAVINATLAPKSGTRRLSHSVAAQKRRINRLLKNYYATVRKHLGIRVRYFPWGTKRIAL